MILQYKVQGKLDRRIQLKEKEKADQIFQESKHLPNPLKVSILILRFAAAGAVNYSPAK